MPTAGVGEAGEGGGKGGVRFGGGSAAAHAAHQLDPGSIRLGAGLGSATEERAHWIADGPTQGQERHFHSQVLKKSFVSLANDQLLSRERSCTDTSQYQTAWLWRR